VAPVRFPGNQNTFRADLWTVKCSEIREALSAWYDGESAPAEPAVVRAHVAGCAGCSAFELALVGVDARVSAAKAETEAARERVPDLAARVVASRGRRRPEALSLRLAVGLAGLGELATTAYLFLGGGHDHHEAHTGNEAVALTVGLCVALLYAAVRPRLAAGYVPVLGVATLLMVVASAHDIVGGEVSVGHEMQHSGLVIGFLLLCLLAARERPGPTLLLHRRPRRPSPRPALHVVGRVVAPLGRVWLRRWVRVASGALMAAALVLVSGPASAHAVLEGSDPAPDAVLRQAPSDVVLRFDEPVTLLPSSLQVLAPDGSRVDDGAVDHHGDDATTATVGISAHQRGTYLVSWRVVSADSHPVSGAFEFSVGTRTTAPTATTSSAGGMGVALGVARWVGYAGAALLVGGLLFLVVCRPRPAPGTHRLLVAGGVVLAVGSAAAFLLKGPDDAALGIGHALDGRLLREVVGTTYGVATLVRLALALVALGLLLARRLPTPRWGAPLTGVLGVGIAVTFALSGHAVAGSSRVVAVVSESVHVLAMSAWLGGLALLLLVVLRDRGPEAVVVAKRFSALALWSVLALAVTGLFQGWRQTRSWGALQDTTYGRELLIKLVLVLVVVTVAASSRAWLWRRPDLGRLRRTVAAEAVGIGVVLGVTSALVATQPASAAYHPSVSANLTILGDTVQVSALPAGDRTMEVHLYVFGKNGQPSEPKELTATVSQGSLGPLDVDLQKAGPGHRQGTVSVPVTGDWTLTVTLRTTAVDQDSADVKLPIR